MSAIDHARSQLGRVASGTHVPGSRVEPFDIADLEPAGVQAMLARLPVEEEWVDVIWPYERAGVEMRYADFVRHYDELWFPSSDDVLVMTDRRDWVLELDHEETVTFVRTT